jgi:2-oxoglutarate dehydrogenase complex dehydrogenase (E1) component-like enzyme
MPKLKKVGAALTRLPEGYRPHKTVQRMLDAKRAMIDSGEGLDWSTAEALAFGTLLCEGKGELRPPGPIFGLGPCKTSAGSQGGLLVPVR